MIMEIALSTVIIIDTVTIGQDAVIDLQSAITYCKEVTGDND